MKPHFSNNDLDMFYKYLNKSKNYFEFGSGGSTYQASLINNIQNIISIESDKEWYDLLIKNIKDKSKLNNILIDLESDKNNWGYPSQKCPKHKYKLYSDQILNTSLNIDLILIDGRFRVACALKSYNIIDDNCIIIFDDFLNRPWYHVVLDYFEIIEKTDDKRMVILKKIPNKIIPYDLILNYENEPK